MCLYWGVSFRIVNKICIPAFTVRSICLLLSSCSLPQTRLSISSEHRGRKTPFPRHKHKSRKTLSGRNIIMLYSVNRRWHKISGDPHAMMEWGLTERESRMEHTPLRWCDSAPNDTDTPQSLQAGQHSSVGHCPPQTQFSPALLRRQACWIRWSLRFRRSRIQNRSMSLGARSPWSLSLSLPLHRQMVTGSIPGDWPEFLLMVTVSSL